VADAAGSLEHVTATEAIELASEGTLLVDVREQWEWDAGHAPTAVHIPMGSLGERLEEIPDDQSVLVICHSGGRSLTVGTALADAGFRAVNVFGGMTAWEQSGGAVVRPAAEAPLA
jgi:rhodanese-related sulfurtransferase